eukprot:CAMPEP_0119362794 /NCGR_PEP_ID=MMETSP1334-20130426/9740_1 /TAXON_ID=127549 /ORGANISM="Calcidiscus leptoporus, Strain RCC1130" /LENGTH=108 /DNA_ID=CAMNT_0007378049 /DNA_START=289 /DNA_END=611 /DNA_ORIENTATION=+
MAPTASLSLGWPTTAVAGAVLSTAATSTPDASSSSTPDASSSAALPRTHALKTSPSLVRAHASYRSAVALVVLTTTSVVSAMAAVVAWPMLWPIPSTYDAVVFTKDTV